MNLILMTIIILVLLAMAIYATKVIPGIDPWVRGIIQAMLAIIAILVIASQAGLIPN